MVDHRHFQRVEGYFKDALSKGATVAFGGNSKSEQDFFAPTIMTNIPGNCDLWEKEIFGPILPFITYSDLKEAIDRINAREKPLAMYIFSKNKKNIDRIIRNTRAGATCVNHAGLHFFNDNLPFGGVNNSGFGKSNGFFGFKAFSNERAVLKQWAPINGLDGLAPPYTPRKQKLIDLIIKWF
jgi:aldehyde dehydrogenase (NAD+)